MERRLRRAAAGVAFAWAFAAAPTRADALRDTVPHIVTTGEASAEVVPDQATIRLGIRNERPTAEDAAAVTAQQAGDVIAAIKAAGVDPRDVKAGFNISAQYDTTTDPQTRVVHSALRGYAADDTLTVRVHDVSKAGSLARALIEKGANSFQGVDYTYAGEKGLRRRLAGEAIKDALVAARTYTEAIDLKLGRVLQIGEEAGNGEADLPSKRVPSGVTTRVAIPTEPGVQVVKESITVTWEIEGKAR